MAGSERDKLIVTLQPLVVNPLEVVSISNVRTDKRDGDYKDALMEKLQSLGVNLEIEEVEIVYDIAKGYSNAVDKLDISYEYTIPVYAEVSFSNGEV